MLLSILTRETSFCSGQRYRESHMVRVVKVSNCGVVSPEWDSDISNSKAQRRPRKNVQKNMRGRGSVKCCLLDMTVWCCTPEHTARMVTRVKGEERRESRKEKRGEGMGWGQVNKIHQHFFRQNQLDSIPYKNKKKEKEKEESMKVGRRKGGGVCRGGRRQTKGWV